MGTSFPIQGPVAGQGGGGTAGGKFETIADIIFPAQTQSQAFVISPAVTFADHSYILCVLDGTVTNSTTIEMEINLNVSSNYFEDGSRIIGGVETILDVNAADHWELATSAIIGGAFPFFIMVEIGLTQGAVGGTPDAPRMFARGNSNGYEHRAGRLQVETASISNIRIQSTLFPWRVGSRFTIYKVSRT